jgi:Zn finger protein HypA/HybF involved in hydrogenase expression
MIGEAREAGMTNEEAVNYWLNHESVTDKEQSAAVWAAINALQGRRGVWIENAYGLLHCSWCGWEYDEPEEYAYSFCPGCGSKMQSVDPFCEDTEKGEQ